MIGFTECGTVRQRAMLAIGSLSNDTFAKSINRDCRSLSNDPFRFTGKSVFDWDHGLFMGIAFRDWQSFKRHFRQIHQSRFCDIPRGRRTVHHPRPIFLDLCRLFGKTAISLSSPNPQSAARPGFHVSSCARRR
jgi:hypothetical protein